MPAMHNEVRSFNPYVMALEQFELAADRIGLSEDMREIFRKPKRELIVNFPVFSMMDASKRLQDTGCSTMLL